MTRWENRHVPGNAYFVTTRINHYEPIFKNRNYCRIIINSLSFYKNKFDYRLIAYVIMPDHIHLIIYPPEKTSICSIMRDFKKFTSKQIIKKLKEEKKVSQLRLFASYADSLHQYSVWRNEFRSLHIYSKKVLRIKVNYIHKNPVKRGLVKYQEDYLYSSYRNYYLGDNSIIDVDFQVF